MATPIDPQSVAFLMAESRNVPMHVGGLNLFEKPEGEGPGYVRRVYEQAIGTAHEISPLFIKRPHRSLATLGQWTWTRDDEFDIEHHVRHNALPEPGRVRELLDLVGRLHGTRLALERPLWEAHLIEGLNDGRLAMYTKIHHSLVDGVSAMRLLQSVFSPDPDERDMRPPWTAAGPRRAKPDRSGAEAVADLAHVPVEAARTALGVVSEAAGLPGALVKTLRAGIKNDDAAAISLAAPHSIFNRKITGARRFAAQDWDLDRITSVSGSTGTTLNDVVLAMCGGALRRYLEELNALPDDTLVSMVPVGLDAKSSHVASAEGGNNVGTLMVKLRTDTDDPAERLQSIHGSMQAGKVALQSMSQTQIIAMAALGVAPLMLAPLVLRRQGIVRPPFNLVISNVPGPRQPMYYNGAKLVGMYPASIPTHGQAMNITCTSYAGQLAFGLTGCRRTVPHLQRLLVHLEDELAALEKAAGI